MPDRKLMKSVKELYLPMLAAGKEVKVTWDGGGDECFLDILIDGESQGYDPDCLLSELLVEVLEIPSVGDSFMSGSGTLRRDADKLVIDHQSRVYGASWDHVDIKAPGFEASKFDWYANARDIDKQVEETVELCP